MSPPPAPAEKDHADFELWVLPPPAPAAPGSPVLYPTLVTSSPAGTATGVLKLDLEAPPLAGDLAKVAGRALDAKLRQDVGRALFDALFAGEVRRCWTASLDRIKDSPQVAGLRLLLSVREAGLAALPWELLHDGGRAIAAISNHSVARYLPVPEPPGAAAVDRLRVLLVVESPATPKLPEIEIAAQQALEQAIRVLDKTVAVDLTVLRNAPLAQIQNELQHDYHVLHFVGHGTAGVVYLVGDGVPPVPQELDQDEFVNLVQGYNALRLVVLTACHSAAGGDAAAATIFDSVGAALVKGGIPAVVAMQYQTVSLQTAIGFSRQFYGSLANGLPVDVAVNEGRKHLWQQSQAARDWTTPVLYLGTRSGRIVSLPLQEAAALKAAAREAAAESERAGAVLRALSAKSMTVSGCSSRLSPWLDFNDALQQLRVADEALRDSINLLNDALLGEPPPNAEIVKYLVAAVVRDWRGPYQNALTRFIGVRGDMGAVLAPSGGDAAERSGTDVGAWFDEIRDKSAALGALIEDRLPKAKAKTIGKVVNSVVQLQRVLDNTLGTRVDEVRRNLRREVAALHALVADMDEMLKM